MKVKELIEKLKEYDPNLDVGVGSEEYLDCLTDVHEFILLYVDDTGEIYEAKDVQQPPNTLGLFGPA